MIGVIVKLLVFQSVIAWKDLNAVLHTHTHSLAYILYIKKLNFHIHFLFYSVWANTRMGSQISHNFVTWSQRDPYIWCRLAECELLDCIVVCHSLCWKSSWTLVVFKYNLSAPALFRCFDTKHTFILHRFYGQRQITWKKFKRTERNIISSMCSVLNQMYSFCYPGALCICSSCVFC